MGRFVSKVLDAPVPGKSAGDKIPGSSLPKGKGVCPIGRRRQVSIQRHEIAERVSKLVRLINNQKKQNVCLLLDRPYSQNKSLSVILRLLAHRHSCREAERGWLDPSAITPKLINLIEWSGNASYRCYYCYSFVAWLHCEGQHRKNYQHD